MSIACLGIRNALFDSPSFLNPEKKREERPTALLSTVHHQLHLSSEKNDTTEQRKTWIVVNDNVF